MLEHKKPLPTLKGKPIMTTNITVKIDSVMEGMAAAIYLESDQEQEGGEITSVRNLERTYEAGSEIPLIIHSNQRIVIVEVKKPQDTEE